MSDEPLAEIPNNQNVDINPSTLDLPRASHISDCSSSTFSELSVSKGFVFQNPDGTVCHGNQP